jgi:hypothetical protein
MPCMLSILSVNENVCIAWCIRSNTLPGLLRSVPRFVVVFWALEPFMVCVYSSLKRFPGLSFLASLLFRSPGIGVVR